MNSKIRATLIALAIITCGTAARADPKYTGDGGVSPFYRWQGSLDAPPGTLLRQEPIEPKHGLERASASIRILYISTDGVGGTAKTVVSGSVYVPKGTPPENGWPVVAWAHGTVGIADVCAPSWRGWLSRDRAYLNGWLANGFAVVATDYQGLGTPGLHPYLQWRPEAFGILDATRAAIATFHLDNHVVVVGQSQGSGAALGAVYADPTYAPDIGIRGAVVTGLVVFLATPVSGAPQIPEPPYAGGDDVDATYSMLYLLGVDQEFDPKLDVDRYVQTGGADLLHAAVTACLTQMFAIARDEHLDLRNAFSRDRQRLTASEDEHLVLPSAHFTVPIFTGTGLADSEAGTIPQYDFISDMCASGTSVSWHEYPGLTHNGTVNGSFVDSLPFARATLTNSPPQSNCTTLAPPGPLQSPTPGITFNT